MKVWTVREIAGRYRVTQLTVYNWLKSGALKGTKNPETGYWEVTQAALAVFKRPRRGREPKALTAVSGGAVGNQPFIPLRQVAKRYGVNYLTARNWARKGYIPAFQIAPRGRWFIPSNMLAQLEERMGWPAEPQAREPTPSERKG